MTVRLTGLLLIPFALLPIQLTLAGLTLERVATNLDRPVQVTHAPGDSGGIYVVEQIDANGSSKISRIDLQSGVKSAFLTIADVHTGAEGGAHSIAFHPEYQINGKFYVAYTAHQQGGPSPTARAFVNRVDEYTTSGGSQIFSRRILEYEGLRGDIGLGDGHGVNWIGFNPTASGTELNQLYITTGDGGIQAGHPNFTNVSQDLSQLYGKVLRIDVGGADAFPGDPNRNYAVPSTNPFVNDGDPTTLGEVVASGLRNPWRASFDGQSGNMFLGDVGHQSREEINFLKSSELGADFGWSAREGTIPTPNAGVGGIKGSSIDPILEYDRTSGSSVTGGFVYRGSIEGLKGKYVFGDFTSNKVWSFDFDQQMDKSRFDGDSVTNLIELNGILGGIDQIQSISSFGEDQSGELYFVDMGAKWSFPFGTGSVFRLSAVPEPGAIVYFTNIVLLGLVHRRRK